jgi:hypothetical protein
MSHTTTIDTIRFTDIRALNSAIAELKSNGINCTLLENATPRAYYKGQDGMGVAPYVVHLGDAKYDVGLYPTEGRTGLEARTDLYGGTVHKVLGVVAGEGETQAQASLGKLYSTYAIAAATNEATNSGYTVHRVNNPNGSVQLRISA